MIVWIWIILGLFNLTFYIYQCIKDGEIKVGDIFISLFLSLVGVIGTVFTVCFLMVKNIDKIVWKRKKDVE
jgi:tellurite resistance protein TehA-like permease